MWNINWYRVTSDKQNARKIFVHPEVQNCKFVFVRDDSVQKLLKPPYDGPFKVLERGPKNFKIQLPVREASISIDTLKPTFIIKNFESLVYIKNKIPKNTGIDNLHEQSQQLSHKHHITRSGRVIRPPVRFML